MVPTEADTCWLVARCAKGRKGPRFAFPVSLMAGSPNPGDVAKAQKQAQAIEASLQACTGCTLECEIFNLAKSDLFTILATLNTLCLPTGKPE